MTWCVVATKPAAEFLAEGRLRSGGYRVYLPVYRRVLTGHRACRGENSMRPLFSGYLFTQLERGDRWLSILSTPGVSGIIRDPANNPALMDDATLTQIRSAEVGGTFDQPRIGAKGKRTDLDLGERVRIAHPAGDLIGTLLELDEAGRAAVLLDILGRTTRTSVDAATLRRAS
jgi:transcription antitermination factor NusG